jgi:steroid delta-isomerase-like uncharacterized protein
MSDAVNKAAAKTYFDAVVNLGDMSAADAIFAPDIQFHYPLGDLVGPDAIKQYAVAVRTAFPDIEFTIADLFGEGDRVAVRWSLVGSQTGEFRGQVSTNKKVSLPGVTVMSISEGKIYEMWIMFNPALLLGP